MKKFYFALLVVPVVLGLLFAAKDAKKSEAAAVPATGFTVATTTSPGAIARVNLAAGQWLIESTPHVVGGGGGSSDYGCAMQLNTGAVPGASYDGGFRVNVYDTQAVGIRPAQKIINLSAATIVSVHTTYSGCSGTTSAVTNSVVYKFFPVSGNTAFKVVAASGTGYVSVSLPAGTWLIENTPRVVGAGGGSEDYGCYINTGVSGAAPAWNEQGTFRVYVYSTNATLMEPAHTLINLSATTTVSFFTSYSGCGGGTSATTPSVVYKLFQVQPGVFDVVHTFGSKTLSDGNWLVESTPHVYGAGGGSGTYGCSVVTNTAGAVPTWRQNGAFRVWAYNTQAAGGEPSYSTINLSVPTSISPSYSYSLCSGGTSANTPSVVYKFFSMAATGIVQVYSVNSITRDPVPSSWDFTGSKKDLCNGSITLYCTGVSKTYDDAPQGGYTNSAVLNSAGPLYAFRGASSNLADIKIGNFFAFDLVKDLFIKVAKAVDYASSSSPPCPPGQSWCTLTLAPASGIATIVFALNWDPVAQMNIQNVTSPIPPPSCADGEICLSDAEPNGASVTIQNTGAGGSVLDWSVSSVPSWLNISTPAPVVSGESQTVDVTYNNSMPRGTNTSDTVWFSGTSPTSLGDRPAVDSPQSVTVNLSVSIPPVGLARIAPTTPSVVANTDATFTASGGMGTTYSWSVTGPAAANPQSGNLNGEGSTFTTKFMLVGTYIVKLTDTDPGNYGQYATVNVPVTAPAANCTFSANPPNVVLLASTTLSWSCTNINPAGICNITGIGPVSCTGGPPCSGSVVVTPTSTTSYVLSCGGVFGGAAANVPLPINVQIPIIREIPP